MALMRHAFADPVAEHLATRRAAGLFDFSFVVCMEVRGEGAVALLHAVQTRGLTDLEIGRIRYTLLLRDDGTVLNDATVWRTGERAFLLFVGRRSDLAQVTDRAPAFDVRLRDVSDETAILAVQGPRSHAVLARCVAFDHGVRYFGFVEGDFAGRRCLVARIGYSGEAGYEIVLPRDAAPALWEALRNAGAAHGLLECGFAATDTLRIEAGHILFTNELALDVTPAELGLERFVARASSPRQQPARGLVGLTPSLRGPPGRSNPVAHESGVIVTSACYAPTLQREIALGYVPWDSRHPGTCVGAFTVARLPFYDPGRQRPRSFG